MKGIRISTRYAKSLLILSTEKGKVDEVYTDMELIAGVVAENRELKILLQSPVIKPDTKMRVLNAIFNGKVSEMTAMFVELLTRKGRESMLGEIAASYVEQVKTYRNVITAKVVSAVPLDADTRAKITALAGKLSNGMTIEMNESVDPELIGGFVLQVGDHRYDASVSGEIKSLKREFEKNPYVPVL